MESTELEHAWGIWITAQKVVLQLRAAFDQL